MKRILFSIALVSVLCINAMGQDYDPVKAGERMGYWMSLCDDLKQGRNLEGYIATLDSMDIKLTAPVGFELMKVDKKDTRSFYAPDPDFNSPYFHATPPGQSILGPFLQSSANEGFIAYPLILDIYGWISPDELIEAELIGATRNDSIDITDLIKVIDNPAGTNADRVIITEYDVKDPRWSDYPHCVSIAFRKKNHYAFPVKIFLNNEGLKNKDRYITSVLNSFRYGDNPTPECIEKEKNVRTDEGHFPIKKHISCSGGIK